MHVIVTLFSAALPASLESALPKVFNFLLCEIDVQNLLHNVAKALDATLRKSTETSNTHCGIRDYLFPLSLPPPPTQGYTWYGP